jgi:hypothetical protein
MARQALGAVCLLKGNQFNVIGHHSTLKYETAIQAKPPGARELFGQELSKGTFTTHTEAIHPDIQRLRRGKKLTRCPRELIRSDPALTENILRDCDRGRGIPPAGIEGEVRDDLGNLAWLDAVIERQVEMVWHLDRLITRAQGGWLCQC